MLFLDVVEAATNYVRYFLLAPSVLGKFGRHLLVDHKKSHTDYSERMARFKFSMNTFDDEECVIFKVLRVIELISEFGNQTLWSVPTPEPVFKYLLEILFCDFQ